MFVAASTRTSTSCSTRPPSRRNLPLLQHAQQLDLRHRHHLGDLVEEQRAAIGQLEAAGAPIGGAGERAALVPEDLALEQRLRNRRAVDGDKRRLGARAELVDRLRDQLLARARLADDEHRRRWSAPPARSPGRSAASSGCARRCGRSCPSRAAAAAALRSRASARSARRSARAAAAASADRPAW